MSETDSTTYTIAVPGMTHPVRATSTLHPDTGRMEAFFEVLGTDGVGTVHVVYDEDVETTHEVDRLVRNLQMATLQLTMQLLETVMYRAKFNELTQDLEEPESE